MSDVSLFSVAENEPQSINIDFSNGSPLNDGDFTIVHYNINSITAEGRLEQLNQVCSVLKVDCLVLTESKLSPEIPSSIFVWLAIMSPLEKIGIGMGVAVLYMSGKL